MKPNRQTIGAGLLALLVMGCQGEEPGAASKAVAVQPAASATQAPAATAEAAPVPATYSGKVIESFNANGYTYVQLDTGAEKVWAAGPATTLEPGMELSISTQMPMHQFHSKALDRDFDRIYFVNRFEGGTAPAAAAPAAPAGEPLAGIEPLAGGQTVAQIHADKQALAGQRVRLRAQVSRYTPKVMGMNWLHVQDSSSAEDLTVTTKAEAAVGDRLTLEGVLVLDKDFGAGYVYELIIEDAEISRP